MIDTKPLEVTDFTGGITDYFIDGQPNEAEALDNFFLRPNAKPITRWGSEMAVTSQLPIGQFRISYLAYLADLVANTELLLAFADKRVYKNDGSTFTQITGPSSNTIFDVGDGSSIPSVSEWQGHILATTSDYPQVQKIYADNASATVSRSAGLPAFPSGASVSSPTGTGSTYSYLFLFRNEYMVGNRTNLDRGPKTFLPSLVSGGVIASGNTTTVTLPTTLASPGNYDTSNLDVEIYRTADGAADYFLVGTVSFGTATFTDGVDDIDLIANTPVYSASVDYDAPPRCKYLTVVNDTGYYANIKDSAGEVDEYTVRQSIPGDADSVPNNFFEKTEQPITGLSSIFDRPLVFCTNYIYRADGVIDSSGAGSLDLRRIDDRAGCVSNASIVATPRGIFWAGEEGFYWSDGLKVKNISKHINETYETLVANSTKSERIYGSFDPSTERIFWSVCLEDGGNEVDRTFVLDLKFLQLYDGEKSRGCFTTLSGGDSYKPTAMIIRDETIYRGDSRGYLFQHKRSIFSDPVVDGDVANPTLWVTQPILFDYKSCFIDFGSKFYRKFVPRILVSAANRTNLSLAIRSSNDNNRVIGELKPISYKQNITWGDSLPVWGDPSAGWNLQGVIEEWRRFPAGGLRCQYKQVQFFNDSVEIISSDLFGAATIDPSAKTLVLSGSAVFPEGMENYVVTLSNDLFNAEYLVLSQSSNTLTLQDTNGSLPTGSFDFKVIGVPKNEILELNGYIFHWSFLSKTHTPFSGGS